MFLAEDKYVFKYITTHVKMLMHEICSYASLLSIKVLDLYYYYFKYSYPDVCVVLYYLLTNNVVLL